MERAVFVYTTWPSAVEAERAGRALVEQGLCACVNILPAMTSIYRWQGVVERADEAVMIIKTMEARLPELERVIRGLHPYDTPAIAALPVTGGSSDFLSWIEAQSRPLPPR